MYVCTHNTHAHAQTHTQLIHTHTQVDTCYHATTRRGLSCYCMYISIQYYPITILSLLLYYPTILLLCASIQQYAILPYPTIFPYLVPSYRVLSYFLSYTTQISHNTHTYIHAHTRTHTEHCTVQLHGRESSFAFSQRRHDSLSLFSLSSLFLPSYSSSFFSLLLSSSSSN